MQRLAGNRAVTELLVQRKVGFEAEYPVPTYGPLHGKVGYLRRTGKVTDEIKSFLDGGVPYGTDIGGKDDKSQAFRLDADHTDRMSREPAVAELKARGWIDGKPKELTTNLEYVTGAVDELAPGSDRQLKDVAAKLKTHMDQTRAAATSGSVQDLGAPAKAGYRTGIPMAPLESWLSTHSWGKVKPHLEKLQKEIVDEAYLQATVGIIPSGIRTFFKAVQQDPGTMEVKPPSASRALVFSIVDEEINRLAGEGWYQGHPWMKGLGRASKESFLGMLTLVYSYMLGDTLHKTSGGTPSTPKNAVPFLLKRLGDEALVKEVGTWYLKDNPPPESFVGQIATFFADSKYCQVAYWTSTGAQSAKKEKGLKKAVKPRAPGSPFIQEPYDQFVKKMLLSGSGFPQVTLGKELPKYDQLPKDSAGQNVHWESFDQMGIPLEYRWIRTRYAASGIEGAIERIVADVREANLREMPDAGRLAVMDAVKK